MMIKTKSAVRLASLAAAASVFAVSGTSFASSHTEAPAISRDRVVDNTDTYAWRCDSSGVPSLCIVANYDGLQLPEGGPNYASFSTSALYSLHITHNDKNGVPNLEDYITIDIDFRAGDTNPASKKFKRVEPDDKAAPPGGGKEFFAQLAGSFDIKANVTMTKGKGNRKTLFKNVQVAPPNIGTRSLAFAYGAPGTTYEQYAQKFIQKVNGYQFFAGPRDDAFYVNLAQVFDLGSIVGLNSLNGAPFRSKAYDKDPLGTGQFADTDPTKAPDGVAGTNVNTIAFSIPLSELMPDGKPVPTTPSNDSLYGVWASASRPAVSIFSFQNGNFNVRTGSLSDDGREYSGAFTQVSRLGLPLINEVIIGVQDKDKFNRTTPQNDVNNFGKYLLNPVLVRDVEAIGGYAQLGVQTVPDDFKYGRVDILDVVQLKDIPSKGAHNVPIENGRTGDVLRVDVAVTGAGQAFPNGRALSGPSVASGKEEDVTDIALLLVLAKLDPSFAGKITDYVGGPGDGRKLTQSFPYLGAPFAGDSEGKGSPAKF